MSGSQFSHLLKLREKNFLATLSLVLRLATSESAESLLGINKLRPHPTLPDLESAVLQDPQVTCVLLEVGEAQSFGFFSASILPKISETLY